MKTLTARLGSRYAVRFASTHREVEAALRLRYEVFNLELREGLESSHTTGQDEDAFDPVCDRLIVADEGTGCVVGTYRMQTGAMARQHLGYYGEQEFDFAPYESIRGEIVELGRACVHRDHRTQRVISLLWRAIADYAAAHGSRYLVGCSSLTSQDAALGAAMHRGLAARNPATPAAIDYELPGGSVANELCYWRDMTFAPHFWNVLGKRGFTARLRLGPQRPSAADRKIMTSGLHREVTALRASKQSTQSFSPTATTAS